MKYPGEHPPVVTLAALSGAGGSTIGPQVAERLGVRFLGRDEAPRTRSQRLCEGLGRLSTITGGAGGAMERLDTGDAATRRRTEGFLAEASRSGGVAVGQGGMVVLRAVPWALHVHVGGPIEARIEQWMALAAIDRDTAELRVQKEDSARISYVRRAYGVDGLDPDWYHLMLDSTVLSFDTCIEIIVTAALSRARDPRPSPPI